MTENYWNKFKNDVLDVVQTRMSELKLHDSYKRQKEAALSLERALDGMVNALPANFDTIQNEFGFYTVDFESLYNPVMTFCLKSIDDLIGFPVVSDGSESDIILDDKDPKKKKWEDVKLSHIHI